MREHKIITENQIDVLHPQDLVNKLLETIRMCIEDHYYLVNKFSGAMRMCSE